MSETEIQESDEPATIFPEAAAPVRGDAALIIDVDGYEGPLDLLLALARSQKVDLSKISILALADQYLVFVEKARRLELDLAADYLVMAAWLAYLKSKLLLPATEEEDEPTGEEMAARLAFQLQRLEAMRQAGARLMARNRLGRDVFARGAPEGIRVVRRSEYTATLYELLTAYTSQRQRVNQVVWQPRPLPVLAIEEARHRLERMLGRIDDWSRLDKFLPAEFATGKSRRSAVASTLSATLELARDGQMELRQLEPFGPVYMRRKEQEEGSPEKLPE